MSRKTERTLTVFTLQNPVGCEKLRKPVADQRDAETVNKTHLEWVAVSLLYKLKPNTHIRSECIAAIIAEYSFWCKRKTNIPVLNDISWEEVHYTRLLCNKTLSL